MEWGGNHSVWERLTSIERYVSDYQMAVIMPSTDLAWYTDTTYDISTGPLLQKSYRKSAESCFLSLSSDREKTFAAGLSMGGYGAVKLGLRKP